MKQMLSYRTVPLCSIEVFTTSVTSFINKCINDVIPTVYISQTEAMDYRHIHTELKARADAFKERETKMDT